MGFQLFNVLFTKVGGTRPGRVNCPVIFKKNTKIRQIRDKVGQIFSEIINMSTLYSQIIKVIWKDFFRNLFLPNCATFVRIGHAHTYIHVHSCIHTNIHIHTYIHPLKHTYLYTSLFSLLYLTANSIYIVYPFRNTTHFSGLEQRQYVQADSNRAIVIWWERITVIKTNTCCMDVLVKRSLQPTLQTCQS